MQIYNKRRQMIILNLAEGRNAHLPSQGALTISAGDLASPQLKTLLERGDCVLRNDAEQAKPAEANDDPIPSPPKNETINAETGEDPDYPDTVTAPESKSSPIRSKRGTKSNI
jgi:hypothetical protein